MDRERELKNLTEKYWKSRYDVEWYIQELLPKELIYLKNNERGITVDPAEILVQLVGYSWEPLLISVCSYKPEKVVPILNETYSEDEDGAARGKEFEELIRKLNEQGLIDHKILLCLYEPVNDQPEDVFRFLKNHVLPSVNKGRRVVVDITGAKKSMVSGAYLFSSYTNTPVAYINYGEYSEECGKPYGYTCKPEELKNPLELFKLHEWGRVRQLYEHYAFQRAKDLTKDIKDGTELFLDCDESTSIDVLIGWLEFYSLWDEGDYRGSLDKWNDMFGDAGCTTMDVHCPTAVARLGKIWPSKDNFKEVDSILKEFEGLRGIKKSIYLKDEEFSLYANDELEKIKRLIKYNEDYRSALLRAAGLNEVLLKARIARLWVQNKFVVEMNGGQLTREDIKNNDKYNAYLSKIDRELLGVGATYLHMALLWNKDKGDKYAITLYKLKEFGDMVKAHRSVDGLTLNEFWKPLKKPKGFGLPDGVFQYRNKAIHFCLTISKEIADVAVAMAKNNLEDFQENWIDATLVVENYETMGWDELCDVSGIGFLHKQRKGEK